VVTVTARAGQTDGPANPYPVSEGPRPAGSLFCYVLAICRQFGRCYSRNILKISNSLKDITIL
jgi:hypothetical protein